VIADALSCALSCRLLDQTAAREQSLASHWRPPSTYLRQGVIDSRFRLKTFKRVLIERSTAATAPRQLWGSEASAGPDRRQDQPHRGKRLILVAFDAGSHVSTVIATEIRLNSHDLNPFAAAPRETCFLRLLLTTYCPGIALS